MDGPSLLWVFPLLALAWLVLRDKTPHSSRRRP